MIVIITIVIIKRTMCCASPAAAVRCACATTGEGTNAVRRLRQRRPTISVCNRSSTRPYVIRPPYSVFTDWYDFFEIFSTRLPTGFGVFFLFCLIFFFFTFVFPSRIFRPNVLCCASHRVSSAEHARESSTPTVR